MSGMTCYETYFCGHDCGFWGSSCEGHLASLSFRGSSEVYEFKIDDETHAFFRKNEMAVLLKLAKRISESHGCSARYP